METLFILGICGLLLCLLLSFFALLAYSGIFYNIQVSTGKPPIGDILVAYKFTRGPYKDAGQIFSEVVRLAPYKKTIGIYYDDPKQVPADKTRYIVGAILAEEGADADEEILVKMKAEGYNVTHFPEVSHAVNTTFPFRCTLSIFIALIRVYPELGSYLKERRLCAHPILELYDDSNIYFIAPLAKQNDFYVEEAKAAANDLKDSDEEGSITTNDEASASYTASEQSSRSLSSFSTEASELSHATTTVTACFNGSSSRGFTDSPHSASREKSLTPATEEPLQEIRQETVESVSVAPPLLAQSDSSPVSIDDDQEWENLGDFHSQVEEELEASVSGTQEAATTPATPDSADLVLLGDLHDGQLQNEDMSPLQEIALPAQQENVSLLQDSVASNLEESGFSESVLSTLQDSGLGAEDASASDLHQVAARNNNAPAVDVAAVAAAAAAAAPAPAPAPAPGPTLATPPIHLPLQQSFQPQESQQSQSPQLVEIESDTASEHSTGSSSYEEVKLAEVTDA